MAKRSNIPTADEEALQAPTIDPVFFAALGATEGPLSALKSLAQQGTADALLHVPESVKRVSQYFNNSKAGNVAKAIPSPEALQAADEMDPFNNSRVIITDKLLRKAYEMDPDAFIEGEGLSAGQKALMNLAKKAAPEEKLLHTIYRTIWREHSESDVSNAVRELVGTVSGE